MEKGGRETYARRVTDGEICENITDLSGMTKHFAITGNIGSGKTTVCHEFERLNVPVYYADERAKVLMTEDRALVAGIKTTFGEEAYQGDGSLNREYLARVAFGDPVELKKLNALVHPAVGADGLRWRAAQTAPYTLHEAAITLEIGNAGAYAGVIVVSAPVNKRCTRVRARNGISVEQFRERAGKQWPDERKAAAADYLIVNDGKKLVWPQVLALHQRLLEA